MAHGTNLLHYGFTLLVLLLLQPISFSQDNKQIQKLSKRSSAVTYTFSGGRLGDNLIAYLHAKWISYKYNIPLLYKPFPYSNELVMDDLEQHYNESDYDTFEHHVTLKKNSTIDFKADSSTLYTIPYFPESREEFKLPHADYPYFEVDWDDKGFIEEIRRTVKPRSPMTLPPLPQDKITVAVHIRKSTSEFDAPLLSEYEIPDLDLSQYADRGYPFKFASDAYYLEQILYISALLDHRPLYVYLFTDAPNPTELLENYKDVLNLPNIEFDCRRTTNRHDLNVLEDFFALTQFDCLIRVDSNFSLAASKLSSYLIQITPKHYYFHPTRGYPIIDQVDATISAKYHSKYE